MILIEIVKFVFHFTDITQKHSEESCFNVDSTFKGGCTTEKEEEEDEHNMRGDLGHAYHRRPQDTQKTEPHSGEKPKEPSSKERVMRTPEQRKVYENLRANYHLLIEPIQDYLPLPKMTGGDRDDAHRIVIIPQGIYLNI